MEISKPSQEGHVMLSYNWESQAHVLRIKRELEKAGYKTWMDVDKMHGGLNERMAEAMEGAAVVVVFMTQKYEESHNCQKELMYADDKRKKIVPVQFDPNYRPRGELGLIAAGKLYTVFSDQSRFNSNFAELKREIDAALGVTENNESVNKTLEEGMTEYDKNRSMRDSQSQEGYVMLSYHRDSQAQVLRIKKELEKAGYKTWMDVDEMHGDLNERMAEGIEGAAVVVVFMTKRYEESHNCQKELEYAEHKRKKIVPVKLEKNYNPGAELGLLVAGKIYVDFSDESQFNSCIQRLKKEVDATNANHC